jgi:hypothetical protein
MDVAAARATWVGHTFDEIERQIDLDRLLAYSEAVQESDPRFLDPSHPDFRAPPTYVTLFAGQRTFPDGFPRFGSRGFDAGKAVHIHGPVRPGDTLTGRSQIHDIYEKTGRSGPMYFIVHRMEFRNQRDELVSVVDWRLVQQPGPEEA